jgi:hypothetical protein
MKNLHVLPTDKPSRFGLHNEVLEYAPSFGFDLFDKSKNFRHNPASIYITSDEEVKEGDYFLYDGTKIRYKSNGTEYHGRDLCHISGNHRYPVSESKKIILTTDQDLIKNGVQAIDDEFLEWFVENPSCEKVEVVKGKLKLNDDGQEYGFPDMSLYKIIIPQEKPKQENCCPKCGELENFHYNYDYSKVEKVHILDILCNECGELFPPILKLPKQKVMKTAMQELIDWATSLQYNQQQCIDWITIKNKAEQLLEKEEPKQETLEEKPAYYELVDKKANENNTIDLNAYAVGVEEGAKWQANRMYSEEDMINYFDWCVNHVTILDGKGGGRYMGKEDKTGKELLSIWKEQFKKKGGDK